MVATEMPTSSGHSLKCKLTKVKKRKFYYKSKCLRFVPAQSFVCVISTQLPAKAHMPAETGAVTMVKSCEIVFTNLALHFLSLLSHFAVI